MCAAMACPLFGPQDLSRRSWLCLAGFFLLISVPFALAWARGLYSSGYWPLTACVLVLSFLTLSSFLPGLTLISREWLGTRLRLGIGEEVLLLAGRRIPYRELQRVSAEGSCLALELRAGWPRRWLCAMGEELPQLLLVLRERLRAQAPQLRLSASLPPWARPRRRPRNSSPPPIRPPQILHVISLHTIITPQCVKAFIPVYARGV